VLRHTDEPRAVTPALHDARSDDAPHEEPA
jgi:hypothetical protein